MTDDVETISLADASFLLCRVKCSRTAMDARDLTVQVCAPGAAREATTSASASRHEQPYPQQAAKPWNLTYTSVAMMRPLGCLLFRPSISFVVLRDPKYFRLCFHLQGQRLFRRRKLNNINAFNQQLSSNSPRSIRIQISCSEVAYHWW